MITFSQMLTRLVIAMLLGALVGLERERVGKEVGIRTAMVVSAGASIFTMVAIMIPYLLSTSGDMSAELLVANAGYLNIIANIVVGIGFLGAGIIIKNEDRVHGLTSAAVVWATAAVGVVAGLGLTEFAAASAVMIAAALYVLRKLNIASEVRGNGDN